jgi:cell pole-organizing protein PopZ
MGDVSAEPSMEDILSSIKRIIAEEGEAAIAPRARKPVKPAALGTRPAAEAAAEHEDDEILELSDPVPTSKSSQTKAAAPQPRDADDILSRPAAQATRGALESLSRLVVKPEAAGTDTLEGLVREMLRPMLRDWLDANLPEMVEQMVAREIARITNQAD